MRKRIKVVAGGTSAGKTFGILPIEIDYAARHPGTSISVVSETIPHLRRGALRDFENIMRLTNRWVVGSFNKALLTYTFKNGSFIEFFSCDQEDRLRGPRRDRLYINEANNITYEAYMHLAIRTKDSIFLDFNPTHEFWVHEHFTEDEDTDFLTLTYKDNEALAQSIIKEIEKAREKAKTSEYWANWWRVYGLGQLGRLQGTVFENWEAIPELPKKARLLGCGLDFGYSNHPTALVAVYKYNDRRILHELLYSTGLINEQICPYLPTDTTIWADSAEPKSIEELKYYGRNVDIRPVTKGSDSIMFGIQIMQKHQYLVTESSKNLIHELDRYTFAKDKNGKLLNKPIKKYDHAIDAVRYHEMMEDGIAHDMFFF